jgi:hypothetical protein
MIIIIYYYYYYYYYKSKFILIFFPGSGISSSATKNHLQIEMEFAHKLSSKDEQVSQHFKVLAWYFFLILERKKKTTNKSKGVTIL